MAVEMINGLTDKPIACQKLKAFFLNNNQLSGHLFVGYPFSYPIGSSRINKIDCVLVSPEKGLVAFNLIDKETVPPDYHAKQDEVYQVIEWNLKGIEKFKKKNKLSVDINVITFAPNVDTEMFSEEDYPLCNEQTLSATLANITLSKPELYDEISIAVRTIGKPARILREDH